MSYELHKVNVIQINLRNACKLSSYILGVINY